MTPAESLAARRLADDEAAVARAPEHLRAAFARAFPPGRARQEDYAGGSASKRPDRSRQTKPYNRKRYRVWLTRCHDPEAVLAALWSRYRVSRNPGWQMAGGEVRDGAVYLGMVYVGVGGVPSDLRKQFGNHLNGIPFTTEECRVEHVDTTNLEDAADVP